MGSRRSRRRADRTAGGSERAPRASGAVDLDAFGGDPDVTARFLGPGTLASDHNRVFLAREDGRAIGAGTAWSLLETVGVFGIAVVERARGRGIGAALTLTASRAFGDCVDLAWLHPTDLARPLYERLGFRAVADWDIWGGCPAERGSLRWRSPA